MLTLQYSLIMDTLWGFEMSDHEDSGDETSDAEFECECEQCGKECPTRHILVSDMHKHDSDELGGCARLCDLLL